MKSERMKRLEAAYDVKGILTSIIQGLCYIPALVIYAVVVSTGFLMMSNHNPGVQMLGFLISLVSTILYFVFPALLKSWLEDTGPKKE
jgi:hypothetical protein